MSSRTDISPAIFRAYDIRGIVGQGLDADAVYWIGRAMGSETLDAGEDTLLVGADARLSSPELSKALIKGVLESGCNVVDLGIVPTPLLYFATHTLKHNSGLMLTGSHNPREYNGIKIVLKKKTLAANQITQLHKRIVDNDLRSGAGKASTHDIKAAYIRHITESIHLHNDFRIVIDCGNGVTGLVAPELYRALGCSVTVLCGEPDGNFPVHHPDPTRKENLQMLIDITKQNSADLGIAFDGDGDRLMLVSARGEVIDADHMLLAFAMDILPDNPGASIVFDVKSSHHLPQVISANGGSPVMCRSGHSFVKQQVLESEALLGGEYSAHIFFMHRWFGFDDGMYAAARFLELLDKYQASAQDLLDKMPPGYSTPELFVAVSEQNKFEIMQTLVKELRVPGASLNYLDGIRADFDRGWALIRASNTTPNLVLRLEADSVEELQRLKGLFRAAILKVLPKLVLPF